jgi:outer membrane protein assembly factor BamB
MKRKFLNWSYCLLAFVPAFISCDKQDDNNTGDRLPEGAGIFVLNQGVNNQNDAGLSFYSTETGDLYTDILRGTLGDGAQDLIIFKDKLFISVSGSARILALDMYSKKTLSAISLTGEEGAPRSPRKFVSDGEKIYVSTFDGYVVQIDPETYVVEKSVQVGPNPEGIAIVDGKIYVANSDGENYLNGYANGKSVSVVDAVSFKEEKKIPVGLNPCVLQADVYGNVFVGCNGNYADIPAELQKIDTKTGLVTTVPGIQASNFTIGGDVCYFYNVVYDSEGTASASIGYFDITAVHPAPQPFVTDNTIVGTPYCIHLDPATKKVYISESNYTTPGKIHVFNDSGKEEKSFMVGMNPCDIAVYSR